MNVLKSLATAIRYAVQKKIQLNRISKQSVINKEKAHNYKILTLNDINKKNKGLNKHTSYIIPCVINRFNNAS
jgi:hypothetical protein